MDRFSIAQAASALGMHEMTVQQLVLEGFIQSSKEGRRRWISKDELDKVIALRAQHGRNWMKSISPTPPLKRDVGSFTDPVTR